MSGGLRSSGRRELVHRQVARKFGSGTAEQLLPLLDRLSDPASIVAIADAVIECETGEEFLRRVRGRLKCQPDFPLCKVLVTWGAGRAARSFTPS